MSRRKHNINWVIHNLLNIPNHRFNLKQYDTLEKSEEKRFAQLTGGISTSPEFSGYHYKHQKSPRFKPGNNVPRSENVKTPNGDHWRNKIGKITHYVKDYENSDIFSDFNGDFWLKKVGNTFYYKITLNDAHVINYQGEPAHEFTNDPKPLVHGYWTDNSGDKSFALASIAAYFAKHNIYEDYPTSSKADVARHVYHDIDMGCGAVKYWNILDGGNDNSKPHIIAHKGENIIIDTGRMQVYNTDGTNLTKYTSYGSNFPPLNGNQFNHIYFYPSIGQGCDVTVTYVPRIR